MIEMKFMKSSLKKMPYQTPNLLVHGSVEKITEIENKTPGSADGRGSGILNDR